MGDFLGFTFGNVHSSDLGITRVSGGDRYEEQLHPEIKDRTAEVPGLNGEYYFGSNFGTKSFDIEIAFDHLTEEQFRRLRQVFGTRDIKELIFNERPYKKYLVKIESPIELSYICFDERYKVAATTSSKGIRRVGMEEGIVDVTATETVEVPANDVVVYELEHVATETPTLNVAIEEFDVEFENNTFTFINDTNELVTVTITYVYEDTGMVPIWEPIYPYIYEDRTQRIYKGEGKITFICYFPFAKSVFKVLENDNEDWAISSGILSREQYAEFDNYDNTSGIIKVYNAGDVNTGFRLYCPFNVATSMKLAYTPTALEGVTARLNIDEITPQTNKTGATDIGFLINTDNELIQGIQEFHVDISGNASYITSGNIYNRYVNSGYFFKIEPKVAADDAQIEITDINGQIIVDDIINESTGESETIEIFYDYLYF